MRETRFTVTLQLSYTKTDEELDMYYRTRDLVEAAAIDERAFHEYPDFITEDIVQNDRPYTLTVVAEVVSE